ncbi:MAG: alpha/beta hydrolase [Planctomycetaceae bacterium]
MMLLCVLSSVGGCARQKESASGRAVESSSPAEEPGGDVKSAPVRDAEPPRQTALAPPVAEQRAPSSNAYTTIRVFYGTNRARSGERQPAKFFGTESGPLSFGFCDVSLPPNHSPGELESPKLWKFEYRPNPEKHVVLMNVQPVSGPTFITELQRAVWDSIEWCGGKEIIGGEVFVFVHGFNNSFEDAARRTAQISQDLKFRGAPVMYSWPSQQRASLRGYQDDAEVIGWSEQHFLNFMAGVARESGARHVHVIAHSMGNRLVTETLRKLSYHFRSGQLPRLNQVVLTAPDIDADYFRTAIAPRIVQTAERITIYSSTRDLALKASSVINQTGKRRLGEGGKELSVFPDFPSIEVVDASTVDTALFSLNHAYHAESESVLNDIGRVLEGFSPGDRGLQSLLGTMAWKIRQLNQSIQQTGHTLIR